MIQDNRERNFPNLAWPLRKIQLKNDHNARDLSRTPIYETCIAISNYTNPNNT